MAELHTSQLSAGGGRLLRRAHSARRITSPAAGFARAVAVTGVLGAGLAIAGPVGAASGYVLPVSFQHIKNINESGVPCESDGGDYTVRGHLTGPRSALAAPQASEITLYLYGFDAGEWNWRFRSVPGYDYATELAKLGHTSVTIDQVGYGTSGYPNGFQSCVGSQAAVTHQIVQRLQSREYTVDKAGVAPILFQKVVLVGHDVGGAVAQIEAYSYKDIAALIDVTFADQGFTPFVEEIFAKRSLVCAQGGEDAKPGGPGGYILFGPPDARIQGKALLQRRRRCNRCHARAARAQPLRVPLLGADGADGRPGEAPRSPDPGAADLWRRGPRLDPARPRRTAVSFQRNQRQDHGAPREHRSLSDARADGACAALGGFRMAVSSRPCGGPVYVSATV